MSYIADEWVQCGSKHTYRSKSEAKRAIRRAQTHGVSFRREHDRPMNAYRCPYCHKFHIGHKPRKLW